MATFLEIKKLLSFFFSAKEEADENSDILIPLFRHGIVDEKLLLSNESLKEIYDRSTQYKRNKLELYTDKTREISLQIPNSRPNFFREVPLIEDTVNHLSYSVGPASYDYVVFLLDCMADYSRENGNRDLADIRIRFRHSISFYVDGEVRENPLKILQRILRVYTIKVETAYPTKLEKLRAYATSFEFHYMYKRNVAITEYTDIQDMYINGRSYRTYQREEVDTPPHRIYNAAVLDYYAMAMESGDPFSSYISFYHVIEHYFDAVYRKKLIEGIRNEITEPDFSYKNEAKLYDLAKYIKKHMGSDDDSGKGNEFESLRYVLMEYAPIDALKRRIDALNPTAVSYFQTTNVPFVKSKDTKVPWADAQGVYTKLARRIYETRNALVHSKSEQAVNQYRPYENKKDLLLEIALIQAVAERVLIESSEEI